MMSESSSDIRTVQELLEHYDGNTTMIYAQFVVG